MQSEKKNKGVEIPDPVTGRTTTVALGDDVSVSGVKARVARVDSDKRTITVEMPKSRAEVTTDKAWMCSRCYTVTIDAYRGWSRCVACREDITDDGTVNVSPPESYREESDEVRLTVDDLDIRVNGATATIVQSQSEQAYDDTVEIDLDNRSISVTPSGKFTDSVEESAGQISISEIRGRINCRPFTDTLDGNGGDE